jgi:predicted transcriptional regulator
MAEQIAPDKLVKLMQQVSDYISQNTTTLKEIASNIKDLERRVSNLEKRLSNSELSRIITNADQI